MHQIIARASDALPDKICWMPRGSHFLTAKTVDGSGFVGNVHCDEEAARAVIASFDEIESSGSRVWLDADHDDGAAVAWVTGFSWDEDRGIMASVKWTPRGESAIRNKEFFSFSPAFSACRQTGRVAGLLKGHAAGGLVNAPAFGAAMPAIAASQLDETAGEAAFRMEETLKEGCIAGLNLEELQSVRDLLKLKTVPSFTQKLHFLK